MDTALAPLFELEYGDHTDLLYQPGEVIPSRTGVRQGSCLGPFWFAFAIHVLIRDCLSRHKGVQAFMYLDDITAFGDGVAVRGFAADVAATLGTVGLTVNASKSEWLTVGGTSAGVVPPSGYATVRAIKVLGAYIGEDGEARKKLRQLSTKFVPFFRRLELLDPDVGACLLRNSGIPRVSYLVRTHSPDVIKESVIGFDTLVRQAWCVLLDIEPVDSKKPGSGPSPTTQALAGLGARHGGMGFTVWEARCANAYAASREAALGLSSVRESDRSLAAEVKVVEGLQRDVSVKAHMLATVDSALLMRDTTTGQHYPTQGIQSWFRFLVRASAKGMPEKFICPGSGCGMQLTQATYQAHFAGCTHCRGYNASSRHASLKHTWHEIVDLLGFQSESKEPRFLQKLECRCGLKVKAEEMNAHQESCSKAHDAKGVRIQPRPVGPDVAFSIPQSNSIPGRDVIVDITVMSVTAGSYASSKGVLEHAWKGRTATKDGLYKSLVEASGSEFWVVGGSAFGQLSASTELLLKQMVAASNTKVSYGFVAMKLASALAMCSGHVIAEGERRFGFVAKPSSLKIIHSAEREGRKGTVAAAVATGDAECE